MAIFSQGKRMNSTRSRTALLAAVLLLPALGAIGGVGAVSAHAAEPVRPQNEEFQYRWQLRNLLGTIAGLFLPNHGDGSLTFKMVGNGHLQSELTITSDVANNLRGRLPDDRGVGPHLRDGLADGRLRQPRVDPDHSRRDRGTEEEVATPADLR